VVFVGGFSAYKNHKNIFLKEEQNMGYTHDTSMAAFTSPAEIIGTVGTWAVTAASHLWTLNKTAADNTSVVKIPLKLPSNNKGLKGALLKSVDLWWSNATGDLDALTPEIYLAALPAQAGTLAATAQSFAYDASHDTAAKRITQATHKMTLTLDTPIWIDNDNEAYVELTVDAAANSVVKLMGASANYTLRI
jgi:hypothetical protein